MQHSHRLLGYQLLGVEKVWGGKEGETETDREKDLDRALVPDTGIRVSLKEQPHGTEEEKAPHLSIIQGREAQGSRES